MICSRQTRGRSSAAQFSATPSERNYSRAGKIDNRTNVASCLLQLWTRTRGTSFSKTALSFPPGVWSDGRNQLSYRMSAQEGLGLIIAGVVMFVGLVGSVLPGIPGAPLILVAAV